MPNNPIKRFKYLATATFAVFIFTGCGKVDVDIFQETGKSWDYPKTVAIVPFSYDLKIKKINNTHSILRKTFFNYFSYLGYNDIPLNTVDLKLAPIIQSGTSINNVPNAQLMKILEVDAIIRGKIINATNFTAGIYAETSIEAKLEMVDLRSNKVMWDTQHLELDSSGIATPSLVDMIEDQAANSEVDLAYHKIAESFALKVLAKIPDPASLRYNKINLPHIESVEANIRGNNELQPNDLVYVTMEGEPALLGHFDIGSFKTRIPMKEVSPGLYTGSYRIKKGDLIDGALIITSLSDNKGLTAKKFYKKALATKATEATME
ncbi:MAG: hypothetical protein HOB32_03810 [Nitrospina sp.]|nr:hypothetical protein [Nitrospina sp.]